LLSGTPAAGSEGVYPIVVTASNGTAPDATQDFTLSVGPFISTTTLPSQGPGKYHATLTVVGGLGSDTWTISAGALPPGLSLDKKTGVVSGKAKTAGTYSFTVQVTVVISKAAPKTYDSVTKGLSITIS
jgi:hypothetical protein